MGFYTCGVFYETHSKLFINSCLFFFDFGKRNCARCGQRLSPEAPVHSVLGLGPDKL